MSLRDSAALRAAALCLVVGAPASAWAQAAPPAAPSRAAPSPAAPSGAVTAPTGDPILAKVGDQDITLGDLRAALASLPPNLRQVPPQTLFPMLLDRLIDQEALAQEAERTGLAKDPEVAREVELAKTLALGSAMLAKEVRPQITEEAVKARYDKEYAGKPGPEEVHAEHILVGSEAQAKDIIAQLKNGASWDALAKKYSMDKGSGANGDLGWFTKDQMVAPFAEEAFKLKPGEISPEPVHSQFGWHVIKVLGRRQGQPPSFDQVKDKLRQQMAQQAAEKAVHQALAQVKVERFTPTGTPGGNGAPGAPAGGAAPPAGK